MLFCVKFYSQIHFLWFALQDDVNFDGIVALLFERRVFFDRAQQILQFLVDVAESLLVHFYFFTASSGCTVLDLSQL